MLARQRNPQPGARVGSTTYGGHVFAREAVRGVRDQQASLKGIMTIAQVVTLQREARVLPLGRRQQGRTLPTAPSPTTTHLMVCILS